MIRTNILVEDYCQNCGCFDPGMIVNRLYGEPNFRALNTTIDITCNNYLQCKNIKNYLSKQSEDDLK